LNKKILVTGGAGYVGSHICKQLNEKGFQPIIFDNLSNGNKSSVIWGDLIEGELREFDQIDKVIKKINPEFIIHLASLADIGESNKDPDLYYSNNILATLNLLKAMRTNKIKNVIFSSSCSIFGNTKKKYISENDKKYPVSPYAFTKYICEKLIESSSVNQRIRYVILRYFNAAGANSSGLIGERNSKRIIPQIIKTLLKKKKKLIINGTDFDTKDGSCVRDFVHVDDVANAHLKSIEYINNKNQNNDFNIGCGKGYSIFEIIKLTKSKIGNEIDIIKKPKRFGDAPYLVSSIRKAKKILKWKPVKSDIDNIIQTTIKWEKKI
tara:strand:- start:8209 stop:9177 length:969 start_codon:yes stop_codon:yes gene_type:complete